MPETMEGDVRRDSFEEFQSFVRKALADLGVKTAEQFSFRGGKADTERVTRFLWTLNEFLYVQSDSGGKEVISPYHQFWIDHYQEILGLSIDENQCGRVAERLEFLFREHANSEGFHPSLGGFVDLTPRSIANARLFTAAQDFTIRFRESPYSIAHEQPELFDAERILKDPQSIDALLRRLGAESQYDKRRKYARLCATLLANNYGGDASTLARAHNEDALEIRRTLVENGNPEYTGMLGYSNKKANMLIRDMYELGVWKGLTNLDKLDVSSDANTMRIALRLGILRTRIPLLTSFLDIYGLQYGAVDTTSAKAWRRVWEKWGEIPQNHRVAAPAFFDFIIYRIGQICCRPNTRACEDACRGKRLEELRQLIPDTDGYCPFRGLEGHETRLLNPPRAISIEQSTGWKRGKTNKGGGGGISA